MGIIRRISLKLTGLFAIGLMLNAIYTRWQYPMDLDKYSPNSEDIISAEHADILYFGDCSDVYCGNQCATDTSISDFIQSMMPERSVATLSSNGYQPTSFLKLIQSMDKEKHDEKTVILTLNQRAFADHIILDWYYTPIIERQLMLFETPFPFLNRALLTFTEESSKREELTLEKESIWRETEIKKDGELHSIASLMEEAKSDSIALSYLEDFAFLMGPSQQQQLEMYENIIHEARSRGWKIILHYVPFNIEGLETTKQFWLKEHAMQQHQLLRTHFEDLGLEIVDHSTALSKNEFLGSKSNSHYTTKAKRTLAEGLVTAIQGNPQ